MFISFNTIYLPQSALHWYYIKLQDTFTGFKVPCFPQIVYFLVPGTLKSIFAVFELMSVFLFL
jgi:hypothetical protein